MQLESSENVPRVLLGSKTQPLTTVSLCCAYVITSKGLVDINCPIGLFWSLESQKCQDEGPANDGSKRGCTVPKQNIEPAGNPEV